MLPRVRKQAALGGAMARSLFSNLAGIPSIHHHTILSLKV